KQPPWQVCNQTSYILRVATMITPKGMDTSEARVKGWQKLYPGQCEIVAAEKGTPRFVYAQSDTVHQGGIREWKGAHDYCIGEEDFIARIDMSCALQNLKPAKFLKVIPTETRTAFVEPDNYGKKAQTAGMQRLLMDNTYNIKRIDGHGGQRTLKTLNKFLKDKGLSRSISATEKFKALEAAARALQDKIGIKFCNQSSSKVWTAIAYDTGRHWQSLGWWPLEPDTCVHPFNRNLKTTESYIYARQDKPNGRAWVLRANTANVREFCVAASRFSAIKHEYCEDRGYTAARFKGLGQDQIGQTITLSDRDFVRPEISGLRQ
ncbi:MAG TPA: DUF1036 domain-containing protein, partial [Hellea balneolensis]|nr:DUF1036 domain-containing protein [Hellea balneolensis]